MIDQPLTWWRVLHFAATLTAAGAVMFQAGVAEPAFRGTDHDGRDADAVRARLRWLWWIGLAVAVVSGAGWLVAVAQQMSDGTVTAVVRDGIAWIVLTRTGFGTAWMVRLALAALLAIAVSGPVRRRLDPDGTAGVALAVGLAGSLAFGGHAAAGTGLAGVIGLFADGLHLVAAAAWAGALVPFAILLGAVMREDPAVGRAATRRFSMVGMAAVGTLIATGAVNTWLLTGSVLTLIATDYGRLLLIKVALFAAMVAVAAVNRLVLTPRLDPAGDGVAVRPALGRLRDNSLIEAALGAAIIAIVGALGTLPPGLPEPG